MPTSSMNTNTGLPTFEIFYQGTKIDDTISIIALDIQQETNAFDQAVITILDGDLNNKGFSIADSNTFKFGNTIEIKLGYDNKNHSVFKGEVIAQKLTVNSHESSQLQVVCKSKNSRNQAIDVTKTPILDLTYGDNIMEAQLQSESTKRVDGFLIFQGFANTNVNAIVSIKGFSKCINGNHPISKVNQHIEKGNWRTTAFVGKF